MLKIHEQNTALILITIGETSQRSQGTVKQQLKGSGIHSINFINILLRAKVGVNPITRASDKY